MPFSDSFVRLPISSIAVKRGERQRKEVKTDDLEQSIRSLGLIQPIVVRLDEQQCPILVVGERRLVACQRLGWPDIPVRFAHELSPFEAKIIELEENIKRQDLTWQEQLWAISSIHQLHLDMNPAWMQSDTANSTNLSRGFISNNLRVAKAMEDPRIAMADSLQSALNVITRREDRQAGNAFAELIDNSTTPISFSVPPLESDKIGASPTVLADNPILSSASAGKTVAEEILQESFLEWAPSYRGPKFNFIHVDFPWGISHNEGPQGLGGEPDPYDDSPHIYEDLLNCFVENIWNFCSSSSHIMFWYSAKRQAETMHRLGALPFIEWSAHPLVWVHSDNSGISPDARRQPRHIYDTCLLGVCGDRNLVRIAADAYSCPTDHKWHPSTKPEPMLRHFFSMFVDEFTYILDPTCGGGSALRAAESLGCTRLLGLEKNWNYCEAARKSLKESRIMKTLHGAYL